MPTLPLPGCAPTPLAHYLKALGILRILTIQRPERVLAHWSNNAFILTTGSNPTELLHFFERDYIPTPLVVPWSGGDFFGVDRTPKAKKWKKRPTSSEVIEAILLTTTSRFAAYRQTLNETFAAMDACEVTSKKVIEGNGAPQRLAKAALLQSLRNRLSDEAVAWIDATTVIEPRAPFFNALLGGGGGSDGNSHFSDNFMQSLWMTFPDFADQREKPVPAIGGVPFDTTAALSESLFGSTAPGTRIDQLSPVLFDSTRVGGANQTSGFEGTAGSNPWDFILMLEGSLLFAGTLGRKLGDDRAPSARFPFLVNASPVGLGSSYLGESSGREVWLPIWSKPAGLDEIAAIFSEGRIEKHGKTARSGTDAFVALAEQGSANGVDAFQRVGFFKGRIGGDNYFTAVDQGMFRCRRNHEVDLLKDIDDWLDRLRDVVQSDRCPASVRARAVELESRITDLALKRGSEPLLSLIQALGRMERALQKSLRWASGEGVQLSPLSGLRADWLTMSGSSDIREFRLAASLAGMRAWLGNGAEKGTHWFRQHLEPVHIGYVGDRLRIEWDKTAGNDVVWHEGDLTSALNAVFARRMMRVAQAGVEGWPDHSPSYARLEDITAFIERRTDDGLLADFVWGLSLIDWQQVQESDSSARNAVRYDWNTDDSHGVVPSSFYALIKLCFRPKSREQSIPLVPAIHQRASAGQGTEASKLAARRLRASGLTPLVRDLAIADDTARRTAAALLFPINPHDLHLLEQIITQPAEIT